MPKQTNKSKKKKSLISVKWGKPVTVIPLIVTFNQEAIEKANNKKRKK